jgi:hypothetical protein
MRLISINCYGSARVVLSEMRNPEGANYAFR